MRFDELLVEDKQLDELNVGKAITGVARGVGKAIGGVAKGVGAVAGGIAGIPSAIKKGFQAGKATVSGNNTQSASGTTKPTTAPGVTSSATSNTSAATSTATSTPTQPADTSVSSQPATTSGAGAEQQPTASADAVTNLQNRIFNLDTDNQREILKLLQTQAAKKPANTTPPPAPAADTANSDADKTTTTVDQTAGKLSANQFGKMATDLAGGAQKTADAKPQQTNQPLPAGGKEQDNFNTDNEAPTTQYGQQKQSNDALKAKLKSGQGLAKTSGGGFKQGMAKGNMRLGAGRGGVTMSHVPQGTMIGEGFSLFRKQNLDHKDTVD